MLTLYHTSHCPNCQAQTKVLQQLQQQDPQLQYESINLETAGPVDVTPAIQSVPTLFIDSYRFEGLMSAQEIKKWLTPGNHDKDYIAELLKTGQLNAAQQWLSQYPEALSSLTELLADDEIEMTVRIGLDALIEQLADSGLLANLTDALGKLLDTASDSLCIDILHYLALIGSVQAIDYIRLGLTRKHPEVQREARELLESLEAK
jgi:hypothetical protein